MTLTEKEISTTVHGWLTETHCSSDNSEGENAQREETVGFTDPQPSEFLFASQEAQNILKSLTRKNEEEQDNKNSIGNKYERSDCHKSTRVKDRWKRIQKDIKEDQESVSPRRSLLLPHHNGAEGGNNKLRPKTASSTDRSENRQRRLIPSPPKSAPPRRMSLSPSRYPVLTPRISSPTRSPSNSSLESINNLDVESTVKFSLSSSPSATCAGNLSRARPLSRRRFSLPVSHRVHITESFHPRNPSSSPHRCSSAGPAGASTRSTSPRRWGSLLTTKMQMNREKLEKLIEERSKVIANLSVNESNDHTSSSARKDKECDLVGGKRASRRPSSTSLSFPPSTDESDVTCSVKIHVQDTSRLSHADTASSEASKSTNIATTSKSRDSKYTSHSRDKSPGRLDGGAASDSRRSNSVSIRSSNNFFVQGTSLSIKRNLDNGLLKKSGSYIRRRSVSTPAWETRQASPSREGMKMNAIRDDDEIKQDIEEELQRLVQLRKKQLIQAAPGSSRRGSAVTRLEARAKCKTTNAQLRKIMNNFNTERTTAQLLSMNREILNVIKIKPVQVSSE